MSCPYAAPGIVSFEVELGGPCGPHPVKWTPKETPPGLLGQAPHLEGCLSCFELDPLVIVEQNVVVHDLANLLEARVSNVLEGFFLQMPKEAFHRGIVPAISTARHGWSNAVEIRHVKIGLGGILAALIAVQDQSGGAEYLLPGLLQGFKYQVQGVVTS